MRELPVSTHLAENSHTWDSDTESFISSKHQRLAQVLHDYNPYFSLVFIPPKDRDETDTKPFAILDSSPAHAPYIVRYLSEAEMDNPNEILGWVFAGDLSKHRPVDVFQRMELERQAGELLTHKQREAELEDQADFIDFLWRRSPKHTIKHNGQVYR